MDADVIEIAEYLSRKEPSEMVNKAVSKKSIQKEIVKLNTVEQLGKFKDSNGRDLADVGGEYSETTQELKNVGPRDVDLKDTGDYWKTFEVNPLSNGDYEIDSDPLKQDFDGGIDLTERWGEDIEGLQPKNENKVNELIEEEIWNQAEKSL